jgi:CHAT domain-containing protein
MNRTLPALAILAAALAASTGAHADAMVLGRNLAGETCQAAETPSATKSVTIVCGAAASGTLRMDVLSAALPADNAARLAAIVQDAMMLRGGQMSCDGGAWLGTGAVLIVCTRVADGWPQIAVAGVSDGELYEADGAPSMLPVLAAAVAVSSGAAIPPDAVDTAAKALQAKMPGDVLRASNGDVANYKQFVEIGRLDGGSDNYAGAEAAYRHALDIETRLFGADSAPVGETLAELALQVSNQGRFDEAGALFRRATPILEGASTPSARARLASYQALDAANQRHFADALKYARAATAARRAEIDAATAGGGDDAAPVSRGELAHSLRIEAEMALRLDDLASARAAGEEAMWIVSEEPGLPLWWRPDTLSLMGEINARQGRVVAAEHNFEDARDLDKKLFGDSAPAASAELRLGAFYSGQQLYAPALAAYHDAFAILVKDPIARAHVGPDQIVPFLDAAVAQPDAARDGEIFRAMQLINGGVADQTIARMAARHAADDTQLAALVRDAQDAQRARDGARIELAAEYAKADDERNGARVTALTADFQLASTHSDELSAKVTQAFPAYAKLTDPGPSDLAAVQAQLGPGEAFVSFVIGDNGGYALLVTQSGLVARHLDITSDALATDVAYLRTAFVPTLGRLPAFSLKSSYALYAKLLGPFQAELAGTRHLIVAPSGALANLPFALLVTAAPGSQTSDTNAAWLIRTMSVSEVPSARALVSLRLAERARVRAPDPFLGVGAPAFTGNGHANASLAGLAGACLDGGPVSPDTLRALPALPETAGEVNSVARSLGAGPNSVLLGGAASESGLRAHPLGDYAVLYFATHGLLPGELHCQSEPALALSPPAGGAATDADGLLTASEIAALRLNADLVVLSACNTASEGGGKFGGSSLEGLADAFFDAGARAVLASHWQVPSSSTVTLMTGVFKRDTSQGLAEALRQSQLALIARPATAHPFDWAAFTLIGDGGAQTQSVAAIAEAGKP